ncbi:alpha/beta fold hydrolase [Microscilla marina]|uniref:Alpha/beta hydrolase superfamily, putative n=1 Tax=Microscilla marina ATCC 23134 TaxID=313606 RepID=A1ZFS7_MICM2|nr:alpha/beta hydrolase [Microscilla marina]EAY30851.1 alpha/beta hydrolase superfamily, putative [Microscilla marina ATCC 23134]
MTYFFLRHRLVFIFCVASISMLSTGCMKMRVNDSEIKAYFSKKTTPVKIKRYKVGKRVIRYIATGADTLPMVIFVHGAPGGLEAFNAFLADSALKGKAHLVSVDRPGYGYSNYGKSVPSIQKQAELLKPLLDSNRSGYPAILVGHSYGGPIIAKMAVLYPKQVAALVLAAPAIDPAHEKIFWISYPADWLLIRLIVPRGFRVANDEKLSHVDELEQMYDDWYKLRLPVTYIHGKRDIVVPFANAAFAKRMIRNAPLEMIIDKKMNHFIPWTHPQYIRTALLKYLKNLKK